MIQLRNLFLAFAVFFLSTFPAFAQTTVTKDAVVKLISDETKNAVKLKDILRIVDAVFVESKKHGIDPSLVFSLIRNESRYNPRARNRSGARGLTQIIPRWHRKKLRGRDAMNIETNIEVGTQILADCIENNKGYIKQALRCYSGNARDYTKNLKVGYAKLEEADIIYRFENELPIAERNSKFETSGRFFTSLNAEQVLTIQENQRVSSIQ